MKCLRALCILVTLGVALAADCTFDSKIASSTHQLPAGTTKLTFKGVKPVIKYKHIAAGEPLSVKVVKASHTATLTGTEFTTAYCNGSTPAVAPPPFPPPTTPPTTAKSDTSSSIRTNTMLAFVAPIAMFGKRSPLVGMLLALALAGNYMTVSADSASTCDAVTEIEISCPAPPKAPAKKPMDCPPETLYYEYPADVYKGYKGCVGDAGMVPCAQDGFESALGGSTILKKPMVYNATTGVCEKSGYGASNMTYWILWGHPMDTYELKKRTGMEYKIEFFLDRGAYPSLTGDDHGDETLEFQYIQKKYLEYIGAFTSSELKDWQVVATEGAEQGMALLWAAKALEIARTTCTRDVYVLVEAPCYGYDDDYAASLANEQYKSFYNGTECPCQPNCLAKTVTIKKLGWVAGTALPTAKGYDDVSYPANSADFKSPWFESMVFPENPSGILKTPQLPNANRRVCDGVYMHPMYYGPDYTVPKAKIPECAYWSFSITKIWSAVTRAGGVMMKLGNSASTSAMLAVFGEAHTIANGIYSEWAWRGQVQIYNHIMAKPLADPTSFVGAYTALIKEKWDLVIDGFLGCPVVEITNPHKGAYVYFKYKYPYLNKETNYISSFMTETLGVKATTYNWGWRGADPADWAGPGYITSDFIRMQLYRDISVYKEVARRAKIVCASTTAKFDPGYMSIDEWFASKGGSKKHRHLLSENVGAGAHTSTEYATVRRHLGEVLPHFSAEHLDFHAKARHEANIIDKAIQEQCAPLYTTSCMFKVTGQKVKDAVLPAIGA